MSDPSNAAYEKTGPALATEVAEVQAIFPSDAALQDAVARLTEAGFDHADLSMPQAQPSAADATPEQGASAVATDTDMRQMRTLGTGMAGAVGAMAAAGVTIATGGAAAVAIGAAAVAGGGMAALTTAAGNAAETVQHDEREASAARGELVLSVRIATPDKQAAAEAAMHAAGATRVAAVTRADAGIDSGSWTG